MLEWVETALKNNVQIRHPKEEVGRPAGNKKARYHVWIEDVNDRLITLAHLVTSSLLTASLHPESPLKWQVISIWVSQ